VSGTAPSGDLERDARRLSAMKFPRLISTAFGGLLVLGTLGGAPTAAKADTASTVAIAAGAAAIVGALLYDSNNRPYYVGCPQETGRQKSAASGQPDISVWPNSHGGLRRTVAEDVRPSDRPGVLFQARARPDAAPSESKAF
jgi:hypothetical protein